MSEITEYDMNTSVISTNSEVLLISLLSVAYTYKENSKYSLELSENKDTI